MKKLDKGKRYKYLGLRLSKDDIKQVCSILGKERIRFIETRDYALANIDEIDKLADPCISEFRLEAFFPGTAHPRDTIELTLSSSQASLTLSDIDNSEAYGIFEKVNSLLERREVFFSRYRLCPDYFLLGIGITALIGTGLLHSLFS